MWLHPTERTPVAEACGPTWLAPSDASIVAVGWCDFAPMSGIVWVNDQDTIVVSVAGHWSEAGRSVFIRVWTRGSDMMRHEAVFEPSGDHAVATAVMGEFDGSPVSGLTLLPVIQPGEEW